MSLKKIRLLLVIISVGILSGMAGYRFGKGDLFTASGKGKDVTLNTKVMDEVINRLKESYLKTEDLDAAKMSYGAVEGMTAALGDPYTAFFPPVENVRSREDLQGEFGGVGIQLGYIEKTLAAMSIIKGGTPAEKAGIRAKDLILNIKDEANKVDRNTQGIGLEEAVNLIRGKKGTEVILTIFREGEKTSREVKLTRGTIVVPSSELKWIDGGKVAVLGVNKFGEKTLDEWNKMVEEILAKKAQGVILDLRGNPGGFLQRAVDLGSEFISSGVIVSQRDRQGTQSLEVNRKGRLVGFPMVVLMDGGSASASEILAGALRDRIGTKLVGDKSFGKGTVQEAQELPDGSGLHVTVAEWLLPSGINIHKVGLTPDVEVKYVADEKNPDKDNQLEKALEVLKGVIVAKK